MWPPSGDVSPAIIKWVLKGKIDYHLHLNDSMIHLADAFNSKLPFHQIKHCIMLWTLIISFYFVIITCHFKLQWAYFISWEPEGRYCNSKMFCWEPEGRYRCTKSMAIAPFWFSMEHLWSAIVPFWLSADDIFWRPPVFANVSCNL